MRLAYFTPFAPVRSGISAYSAELLPVLVAGHEVDVYVEDEVWIHWARQATGRPPNLTRSGAVTLTWPGRATDGAAVDAAVDAKARDADAEQAAAADTVVVPALQSIGLWRAHDFVPRHLRAPYDLLVYQLGNATCHEFMWPYVMRYPGLVVLHDGQLHHARAHALLRRNRKADYVAEFAYAHPDAPPDLAEFVVAGLQGPVYYMWPLVAAVVRRARLVAVHNARLAGDLREAFPDAAIETIRMGVPAASFDESHDDLAHGAETGGPDTSGPLPRSASRPVRFAAFGLVTPEKRIPQALRALAATLKVAPDARLTLVGETTEHYDVRADAEALGIADRVEIAGYVPDEALAAHIAAADVCLCLRWPTARETSASWLRCLAAGKATIVNDLTHLVDVPTLDPRTWTLLHARADAAAVERPPTMADAVAVSIDILDEDHSLALAVRRLACDAELRDSLGRAARRRWAATHTLSVMADDYARVIARAAAQPVPEGAPTVTAPGDFPSHLLEDYTAHGRRLAEPFGVTLDW